MSEKHTTPLTAPESTVLAERFSRLSEGDANRLLYSLAPYCGGSELATIGDGAQQRDYFACVQAIAEEATAVAVRAILAEQDPNDAWHEHVHESVDGSAWVIYTGRAIDVLRFSSNDGAYFDSFGDEGAVDSSGVQWSQLAFCAMEVDIEERQPDFDGIAETIEGEREATQEAVLAAIGEHLGHERIDRIGRETSVSLSITVGDDGSFSHRIAFDGLTAGHPGCDESMTGRAESVWDLDAEQDPQEWAETLISEALANVNGGHVR